MHGEVDEGVVEDQERFHDEMDDCLEQQELDIDMCCYEQDNNGGVCYYFDDGSCYDDEYYYESE